jgi:hypothetical protein
LPPKKIVKSPVLRRSFKLPAQSATEKAPNKEVPDLVILRPKSEVAFKYRNILLTVAQWIVVVPKIRGVANSIHEE